MGNQQRASADVLIMFGQAIEREQRRMRSFERSCRRRSIRCCAAGSPTWRKASPACGRASGITSSPFVPAAERIRGRGGEDRRVPARASQAGPLPTSTADGVFEVPERGRRDLRAGQLHRRQALDQRHSRCGVGRVRADRPARRWRLFRSARQERRDHIQVTTVWSRSPGRTAEPRKNPANRPRLLALENAAERRRARPLHRARRGPQSLEALDAATRPASAGGARFSRYAGGARLSLAQRRSLLEHAGDRSLSRQGEAVVHRRHPRDGQPSPVSVLGPPDRGVADRAAAERSQGRRARDVRDALRRSGAAEGVPRGDDRHQSRREHDDRAQVSLGGYKTFVDVGTAQGDLGRADRARQSASDAGSGSICRRSSRSSRSTSRRSASRIASTSRPETSSRNRCPRRT